MTDLPDDFPHDTMPAVAPGMQNKIGVILSCGHYVAGQTDQDRAERYNICAGLGHQLVSIARKDAAKRPADPHDVTLARVRKAIATTASRPPAELDWLMRRVRTLLNW
ncbi:hypothetical protein [Paraburkholderia sp. RL17-337-BIB-A]|uniref:hypothetical protein n=1 Tax=Paraburkholderia sp. RL17-337-BIB-A TaxID=3031636 RepID=UPI0038BA16A6